MAEEGPVLQHYKIFDPLNILKAEPLSTEQSEECQILYYIQDESTDNSGDIVITEVNSLIEAPDDIENDSIGPAPFKVITMHDGEVRMTETSSLEEIEITTDESNISQDRGFREIDLDGTRAFIEEKLWKSFTAEEETVSSNTKLETTKIKKRFLCTIEGCGKIYTSAQHLMVHTRTHTGAKPYQCPVATCNKAFSTGYSLKSHVRCHSGEKPYACTNCPKQFKTSGDLAKHVRTHTGERPFLCPVEGCGRSFTTTNIRKVHVRSHTGERPYLCKHKDCGKAFASATNYKNHLRIHTGEKPYACNVQGCKKRFTEYSSLYKHSMVHIPDRPHRCEYCGQLCKLESSLRQHKRSVHNVLAMATEVDDTSSSCEGGSGGGGVAEAGVVVVGGGGGCEEAAGEAKVVGVISEVPRVNQGAAANTSVVNTDDDSKDLFIGHYDEVEEFGRLDMESIMMSPDDEDL